ncbi:cell division protein 48-like protein [Glossina pallidipes salivary gland hypertrophy virus]|uniref:Cell division protein 48-like protein n=1 Tax=Glossina hytrovirus (isolate Glossina pallidipes/Ethiopia/Seibersdorf/-) TaxID=379529 RepID=B0YLR1_GHVS|nr:cell division protein 48-like protein [Glossina pallidipes salivary gland hypertrophy virus]ABQ08880.1 cell division protein 48-like protein [Glossina pallidipes salivary gland hypertrophy virus]
MGTILESDFTKYIMPLNLARNYQFCLNSEQFIPSVDSTKEGVIPRSLRQEYDNLNNILTQILVGNTLQLRRSSLQQFKIRLHILIIETMHCIAQQNSDGINLSFDQYSFTELLNNMALNFASVHLLLNDSDTLQITLDKIRAMTLTAGLEATALSALVDAAGGKGEDSIASQILKSIQETKVIFSDLRGIDNIVNNVQSIVDMNITRSTNAFFLFCGPPGTGKTTIAQAIASAFSDSEFFNMDTEFFSSQIIGHTEKKIKAIFKEIRSNRQKNYTIIIDEIDNVIGTEIKQSFLTTVKTTLQTEISGTEPLYNNLIICGMTNYKNKIDEVMLRRITNIFYVPMPDFEISVEFFFELVVKIKPTNEIFFQLSQLRKELLKNVLAIYATNNHLYYTNHNMKQFNDTCRSNFGFPDIKKDSYNIRIEERSVFYDKVETSDAVYVVIYHREDDFICMKGNTRVSFVAQEVKGIKSVTNELKLFFQENNKRVEFIIIPSIGDLINAIKQTSILTEEQVNKYQEYNS